MGSTPGNIENLQPGDHFEFTTPASMTLKGEAQIINPPQDFTAILENFDDARLRVAIDKSCDVEGEKEVKLFISTYGLSADQREALQKGIEDVLESMKSAAASS